jgi:hypothetical protein
MANERQDRLEAATAVVERLGHVVVARELEIADVAATTARMKPDVALVAVGESSDHALTLISRIVQEAACPVIALLEVEDVAFVHEAARRGASPTSSTVQRRSSRARSTSRWSGSRSSRTWRARSGAARSPSGRRGS